MQFVLHQGDYTTIPEWVRTGEVDFGFVNPDAIPSVKTKFIKTGELRAVLPLTHPLEKKAYITLDDLVKEPFLRKNVRAKHYHVTFKPLFDDPGTVDLSGINWIVVGTMTGAQSRKIHTEPEWAWSLTDQAHALGIPVFMKEDLVPIMGDENMIQEIPEEFNKVVKVQRSWQK